MISIRNFSGGPQSIDFDIRCHNSAGFTHLIDIQFTSYSRRTVNVRTCHTIGDNVTLRQYITR